MADINAKARRAAQKYMSLSRTGKSNKEFLRKKARGQASRYSGASDPEYRQYLQQIAAQNAQTAAWQPSLRHGIQELMQGPPQETEPATYSEWKAAGKQHPPAPILNVVPFGPGATLARVIGARPTVRSMGGTEVVTKGRPNVPQGHESAYVPAGKMSAFRDPPGTATGGPVRQYTNAEIARMNKGRQQGRLEQMAANRPPQRRVAGDEIGPVSQWNLHPRQQIKHPIQGPPRPRPHQIVPSKETFKMFRGKSQTPINRIGRDFSNQPPSVPPKHRRDFIGRSGNQSGTTLSGGTGSIQKEYPIVPVETVKYNPANVKSLRKDPLEWYTHPQQKPLEWYTHPQQQKMSWFAKADRFARDTLGQSSAQAKRIAETAMGKAKTPSGAVVGAGKKVASKVSKGVKGVQDWAAKPSSEIVEKYFKEKLGKDESKAVIDKYVKAERRLGKVSSDDLYKMKPSELVKHFEKYDIELSLNDARDLLVKPKSYAERGAVGAAKMAVRGAPKAAKWGAGLTAVGGAAGLGYLYNQHLDKEAQKKKDDAWKAKALKQLELLD